MHSSFDFDHWSKLFPLSKHKRFDAGAAMPDPVSVALVEQVKRRAVDRARPVGDPVPIDLFVWNYGESTDRGITCVGGLPYRASSLQWPHTDDGKPLTFVAQFSFLDSQDITGPLPGDFLLLFAEDYESLHDIHFEWHNVIDEVLVSRDQVPATDWNIQPCFASILRTSEYPDADRDCFDAKFPLNSFARGGAGSKIGGFVDQYDYSIHLDPDLSPGEVPGEEHQWAIKAIERQKTKGDLLCRLESVWPCGDWPFINRKWDRSMSNSDFLLIYDVGAIDIYLNPAHELSSEVSSH